MINFYLRSAVRSILRKKGFSLLNIMGLTIGITIFLVVLEYYSYEKGFNAWHSNRDVLYRVDLAGTKGKSPETPPAMGPDMKRSIPGIRSFARFCNNFTSGSIISSQPAGTTTKLSFREQHCVFVDKTFLDLFSFPVIKGTNALDDPHAVVITEAIANKIFGTADPIGQTLEMHNQFGLLSCRVAAVVATPPSQSDIVFDYLFSMRALEMPAYIAGSEWASPASWSNDSYTTFVQLDAGINPAKIAAAASALWVRDDPQYRKEEGSIVMQPLSEIHLGSSFKDDNPTSGSRPMVYAILYLGILVLVIAWINFVNFSTAFALSQVKAIGIHKILGSGSRQIVGRYIMESFLLNVAGLGMALLLAQTVQSLFNYLTGRTLSIAYLDSWSVWLIGVSILSGGIILCGAYVGWSLARLRPVSALHFESAGHPAGAWLRKGLVVFQFAVSILFIIATLAAYSQVSFMKRHELGMNIHDLVVVDGPQIRDSSIRQNAAAFKNELAALPFVTGSCNTGSIPGPDFAHNYSSAGITGPAPAKGDSEKQYEISEVDDRFFPLYRIVLAEGRNFTSAEVTAGYKSGVVILNESAAAALGLHPGNTVHSRLSWQGKYLEVVGVVKDYHHQSLKTIIEPIIYLPQNNINKFTLRLTPGSTGQKIASLKTLYTRYFPGNPFGFHVLEETYNTQYAEEDRGVSIALSVSVFIILIAILGLVGLSVFTVKRRVREIGIRKVLGATTSSLFRLLSREFLLLVLVAFVLAAPTAGILLNVWLRNFAYHTGLAYWTFILPGAVVMVIALCTISIQTVRAALANPVNAIRTAD